MLSLKFCYLKLIRRVLLVLYITSNLSKISLKLNTNSRHFIIKKTSFHLMKTNFKLRRMGDCQSRLGDCHSVFQFYLQHFLWFNLFWFNFTFLCLIPFYPFVRSSGKITNGPSVAALRRRYIKKHHVGG